MVYQIISSIATYRLSAADVSVKVDTAKTAIAEKSSGSTLLILIGIFVIICLLVVIFKIMRCMNNENNLDKYMDDSDDDNYRRNTDGP